MKTILWYGHHRTSMLNHSTEVDLSLCTFNKCRFEYVIKQMDFKPEKHFNADAILIHGSTFLQMFPPPRRDENQVFVLAVRETTGTIRKANRTEAGKQWINAFNWTMTFRLDSDIVLKYSDISERTNRTDRVIKNYDAIYRAKSKEVAWYVSHCKTKSHREDYVRELSAVIDVDIYGACGITNCPKKNTTCFNETETMYKFYLAFENSFFTDYVTEKLIWWFDRDIIVVVRGGANYTKHVPPGTVIDASDFKSATELGKYLKKVAADKDLYLSYLRRKDNFIATDKIEEAQKAYCKLCENLHTLDDHRKSYKNISDWWDQGWQNNI